MLIQQQHGARVVAKLATTVTPTLSATMCRNTCCLTDMDSLPARGGGVNVSQTGGVRSHRPLCLLLLIYDQLFQTIMYGHHPVVHQITSCGVLEFVSKCVENCVITHKISQSSQQLMLLVTIVSSAEAKLCFVTQWWLYAFNSRSLFCRFPSPSSSPLLPWMT